MRGDAPTRVGGVCCAEPWVMECEHWRLISRAALAEELGTDRHEVLTDDELAALESLVPQEPARHDAEHDRSVGHLPAEVLRRLRPDADLASLVEGIRVEEVEAPLAVEVVAAYKRLEAWAAARAARAAAAVSRRAEMEVPDHGLEDVRNLNVAGEELAIRLGVTRSEANTLIDVGRRAFTEGGCLAPTGDALEEGALDWRKTCTVVRTLGRHPDVVAWLAQQEVLPGAALRTHNQLVRDLSKALIAVDAEEADLRHRRAAASRRVTRPRPLPDGMAEITAVLPAADAVLVDVALHAAARGARRAGCGLSTDQLRADALTAMAGAALDTGWIGRPPRDAGAPDDAEHGAEQRASIPVAPGYDSPEVTDLPGVQPVRAPMRLSTAGRGRIQVRITVPLSVALPPESSLPEVPTAEPATSGHGRHPPPRVPCTDPLLQGLPDGRAEPVAVLDGYGPVPPEVARALAAGGTWQRMLVEPASGALLDLGRRRYRPPAELAALVRARDRTCVRPGCTVPAEQCQLDHTRAWSAGGTTEAGGLGPMCLRDHQIKSAGAFTVRQPWPGVFEWSTAAGLRYRRYLDGTVAHVPHCYRDPGDI